MRILLALLFIFVGIQFEAKAAAPVISCTPSRTTGTAPLFVHLDCTGTTDADTTKPFHALFYVHTFGDPSAGLWSYGANTALSKNFATGPVAGHIYETAGTYTITSTVSDGTNIARTTNTITVSDPDTTYSTTKTYCITNGSDFTGCPSGASQISSQSDGFAALVTCLTVSTRRCLYRRGDTFSWGTTFAAGVAGPITIGAYGSGAKPIINLSAATSLYQATTSTQSDTRFMDLDIRGGNVADASQQGFQTTSALTNITFLRVDMSAMGSTTIGLGNDCTGCVIQDSTLQGAHESANAYVRIFSGAVLGNQIGPVLTGGQHALRIGKAQKAVFSSNTVTTSQPNKEVFGLQAQAHATSADDSFYNIVSDNKIIEGTLAAVLYQSSNAGATDVRLYDNIVERNWFQGTEILGTGFDCTYLREIGTRVTIRNNLFQIAECGDFATGVYVLREGASDPSPTDVNIYNNTFYTASTKSFRGVWLPNSTATNTIVKNNLCWFDNATGTVTCLSDSGTGTTASNNSTDPQTTGTDPSFDGGAHPSSSATPIDFRIGTGSYAASGGTSLFPSSNDDFFHCDDTTANERMGAFVSRTRATCRGAAGP